MRAESSPAARTGAFIAVAVALFCIQLDFFALDAGVVFLAAAVLVALSGPLGARLSAHPGPMSVMALAGAVAGTGMIALSHVMGWWPYVPVFAWCGLGLGLGRAFAGVAPQQVVAPERAGEASGVLLTFLVTLGGVAPAGAAAAITVMVPERTPEAAYDAILRFGGAVILVASVAVMAVRHRLVVLGGVPPVGSRAPRGGRLP